MVLWLKFDSADPTLNSACTDDQLIKWNHPRQLPANVGLYRNWGIFFDDQDVIEIPGGI